MKIIPSVATETAITEVTDVMTMRIRVVGFMEEYVDVFLLNNFIRTVRQHRVHPVLQNCVHLPCHAFTRPPAVTPSCTVPWAPLPYMSLSYTALVSSKLTRNPSSALGRTSSTATCYESCWGFLWVVQDCEGWRACHGCLPRWKGVWWIGAGWEGRINGQMLSAHEAHIGVAVWLSCPLSCFLPQKVARGPFHPIAEEGPRAEGVVWGMMGCPAQDELSHLPPQTVRTRCVHRTAARPGSR